MSEAPELFSYTFTWHALMDACEKCGNLDGREWRNQDLFQPTLIDPVYGEVWDLDADHSLAHPNCRCQLEVIATVELGEEHVRFQQLMRQLR